MSWKVGFTKRAEKESKKLPAKIQRQLGKTHRTERVEIRLGQKRPRIYLVPKEQAIGLAQVLSPFEMEDWIPAEEVFPILKDKAKRPATVLQGIREREQLSQESLARKAKIPQSHISAMERGTRPIGKKIAQKLGKALNVDYRVFL